MRGGGRMATAAGPSCGPSAQGVKPPSVLRPGCCCYMQEIAPVDYWHQAHISSLGGPRHFGTGPGLTLHWITFKVIANVACLACTLKSLVSDRIVAIFLQTEHFISDFLFFSSFWRAGEILSLFTLHTTLVIIDKQTVRLTAMDGCKEQRAQTWLMCRHFFIL